MRGLFSKVSRVKLMYIFWDVFNVLSANQKFDFASTCSISGWPNKTIRS